MPGLSMYLILQYRSIICQNAIIKKKNMHQFSTRSNVWFRNSVSDILKFCFLMNYIDLGWNYFWLSNIFSYLLCNHFDFENVKLYYFYTCYYYVQKLNPCSCLKLLDKTVNSLCYQYRARPGTAHLCRLTRLSTTVSSQKNITKVHISAQKKSESQNTENMNQGTW